MNSNSYNISIIIIGYNTLSTLPDTLNAINHINVENHNVEVIYIDDSSTDGSYEFFKNLKLNFKKLEFRFKKNSGRVAARLKGIEMASGEWLLFLNSNIIVNPDIIIEYSKSISTRDGLAYSGCLNYNSPDLCFSKYLNNLRRGIKKYNQHEVISYQNFLFSNCIVQKSIMNSIPFNPALRYYGGEELDWSYKFSKKHPNMMRASKLAMANRNNHPRYREHLNKMMEFGSTNFVLLDRRLQIDIIRNKYLLNKNILFKALFNLLYFICISLYKLPLVGNHIVKIGLLASILRGYYKNKL